jgi:hypothetical protein
MRWESDMNAYWWAPLLLALLVVGIIAAATWYERNRDK